MTGPAGVQNETPDPNQGREGDKNPVGGGAALSKRGEGKGQNSEADRKLLQLRPKPVPVIDRAAARFPLTDLGNAERFALRYGANFRFCPELGWFRWDNRRWELLSEEKDRLPAPVMQAVFATVRAIKNEAVLVYDSGIRNTDGSDPEGHAMDVLIDAKKGVRLSDKIMEWARTSESAAKLGCIATLVKSFDGIVVKVSDFDADRMAINCLNGTLRIEKVRRKRPVADIEGGKSEWHMVWDIVRHDHKREDLITKITRVKYQPKALSPVYDAFFEKMQPDPVMRRFICQWGGLSMTGDIGEQKLAFFYGQGRNGKGTWVETVAWIAGDYAGSLPVESLLDNGKRRGDQATPDIARLPGVRFLRVSEPSNGAVLNEGLVKMVTGGDPVDARHLNKGLFTFLPEFKMTISGNQKPAIRDTSDGIWRRMQLVPWDVQIPVGEVDKRLVEKLQDESTGIFARLMEGLLDWRINGLIEPEAVRMATSEYRDDSDDVGKFLRQCCLLGEDSKARPWRVRVTDLYALFEAWANQTGSYVHKSRSFSKAIERKGFKTLHSNGSWWLGIQAVVYLENLTAGNWTAADVKKDDGHSADRDAIPPGDPKSPDDYDDLPL